MLFRLLVDNIRLEKNWMATTEIKELPKNLESMMPMRL
jgi:hypothetical protein